MQLIFCAEEDGMEEKKKYQKRRESVAKIGKDSETDLLINCLNHRENNSVSYSSLLPSPFDVTQSILHNYTPLDNYESAQ